MLLREQLCTVGWTLNYFPEWMETINKIMGQKKKWDIIYVDTPNITKKGGDSQSLLDWKWTDTKGYRTNNQK